MASNVVIVDDEKLVLYGLSSLLTGGDSPYSVAGAFCSGSEALRFCTDFPPEILLTDIGMPGMDGLELISRVRGKCPSTKIVVLSCHDEYDMVHRAFKLGADDYILKKDIDRAELIRILGQLKPEDSSGSGRGSGYMPLLSESWSVAGEGYGLICVIGFGQDSGDDAVWQPNMPMLYQLARDSLVESSRCFLGPENDLVVLVPDDMVLNSDDGSWACRIPEKLRRSLSKYINRPVFIAVCPIVNGDRLGTAYGRALEIMDGIFYCRESSVLIESTYRGNWKHQPSFRIGADFSVSQWHTELDAFFSDAERLRVNSGAVRTELLFSLRRLIQRLQETGYGVAEDCQETGGEPYYRAVERIRSIERLKNWSLKFIDRLAAGIRTDSKAGGIVGSARLYVDEHLDGDLRLSLVAEHLGVNASHLSYAFKKENGISYIEYVNRKRVELACGLLKETDLTAKEIAYRCGYPNANYFSRIFKRYADITVSCYRSSDKP